MTNPIYSEALSNVRKNEKLTDMIRAELETLNPEKLKGASVLLDGINALYLASNTKSDSANKQRLATEAKKAIATVRTIVQRESLAMFDVKIGAHHSKKTGVTTWKFVVAQKTAKRDILTTLGKTLDNDDALSDAMLEQIAEAVQSIVSGALDDELSNVINMAA